MPRTTLVLPTPALQGDVTVTTSQTNLLQPGTTITAGAMTGGIPVGDADAYSIVVANTGAQDITLSFWIAAGPNAGLRLQLTTTVSATSGVWTYQFSGNAARAIAITAVTGASTTTVRADLNAVVSP